MKVTTHRCLINGVGEGGQNKRGGSEIFVKFNKRWGQNKRGCQDFKKSVNPLMNEKRDINV